MKKILLATMIALSAGLTMAPTAAYADRVVQFKYVPAELKTIEGRENLILRLKNEARKACSIGPASPYSSRKSCREDVESQLVAAIGSPELYALIQLNDTKLADARH